MKPLFRTAALVAALATSPAALNAQAAPLRVFLDCSSFTCDQDYVRTELDWISHMRDRADAQVHVLVTTEGTGGGGTRWSLNFIGLRELEGRADTLVFNTSADATNDARRRALVQNLALGLVSFAARTPYGQHLSIGADADSAAGAVAAADTTGARRDPWNFWTFTVGLSGFGDGQSTNSSYNINGNITANRTTEQWKLNTRLNGRQRQNTFEYVIDDEPRKTVSTFKDYSLNTLVVKSLGPHLSAGITANLSTSTFGNTSLGLSFAPAIEYNFIPYAESTRRQLTVRYSTGGRYADYREVTIFGETEEARPHHQLEVEYGTTQPWGRVYLSADAAQYLHDRGKYNAGFGGNTELRLFKGFSFNVGGNYSLVRDQLSLPGRDLTEEEILLQQRQQATNFSYFISAGISYRFGSIFNNVVNPRFGGGGGNMIIIM